MYVQVHFCFLNAISKFVIRPRLVSQYSDASVTKKKNIHTHPLTKVILVIFCFKKLR